MILNPSFLRQHLAQLDTGIEFSGIPVGIGLLHEGVERCEIQSEVQVMDESLLAVAYVHESGVQGREKFLDSAKIYIPYREAVILG